MKWNSFSSSQVYSEELVLIIHRKASEIISYPSVRLFVCMSALSCLTFDLDVMTDTLRNIWQTNKHTNTATHIIFPASRSIIRGHVENNEAKVWQNGHETWKMITRKMCKTYQNRIKLMSLMFIFLGGFVIFNMTWHFQHFNMAEHWSLHVGSHHGHLEQSRFPVE